MKITLIIAGILMISTVACKQKTEKNAESIISDSVSTVTEKNETTCYSYTQNNDTITMSVNGDGNKMIGDLNYDLYQKDKNVGVFEGEMSGDTLIATYVFVSEGQESKREVVFIKTTEGMVEGFGKSVEKDNSVVFEDRSKLNFGSGLVLKKVDCE